MIEDHDDLLWLRSGRVGETRSYHEGNLMRDRVWSGAVAALADRVWAAYRDGRVMLTQRRISPGVCVYFATLIDRKWNATLGDLAARKWETYRDGKYVPDTVAA
jgi:hypothetical protein